MTFCHFLRSLEGGTGAVVRSLPSTHRLGAAEADADHEQLLDQYLLGCRGRRTGLRCRGRLAETRGVAVSFDLYVWHENEPITAAQARAKLERWGDDGENVFAAHPAVGSFYDALLDRFPPLESFSDADIDRLGVWSVTPERSDAIVAVSCVWSRADEVGAVVLALAAEHGLVCYEPGYHVVNPNVPGYAAAFTLSSENLPTVPDRRSPIGMDHGSGGPQQPVRGP